MPPRRHPQSKVRLSETEQSKKLCLQRSFQTPIDLVDAIANTEPAGGLPFGLARERARL